MQKLLLAAALLLSPQLAMAHAILVQSQPADQATVPPGERTLVLRYNSRIDHKLSRLTLQGTNAQMTLPINGDSPPDALSTKADLTPGDYVVHWQVLATDGHMTRGDVHFTVR
ncbi:MAG: copper resistance protein CopC [Acetobacteraceae bacterium]|nr:copper resistance protein CopC [Acetobacteraceae bacterium]